MTYQIIDDATILRASDSAYIPRDPSNRDFLAYLEWEAQGNTPDPAPSPASQGPLYQLFWDGLLVSSVYQTIRAQAINNPEVLIACTEFIAAFSDAKAGRANSAAIQACINYLLTNSTLTQAELDELAGLMFISYLDTIYTLV